MPAGPAPRWSPSRRIRRRWARVCRSRSPAMGSHRTWRSVSRAATVRGQSPATCSWRPTPTRWRRSRCRSRERAGTTLCGIFASAARCCPTPSLLLGESRLCYGAAPTVRRLTTVESNERTPAHTQLAEDILQVFFDGIFLDVELTHDLLVRQALP